MKKTLLVIIIAIAACLPAAAQRSQVVTDTLHSKALGVPRAYTVYLPPSFESQPEKQYPVLYLLHGMWGANEDWAKQGRLQAVADQLLRSGEIDEMVIVTPDAGGGDPNEFQNGYFDMPGWAYETFFFDELMPAVEKQYRAIGDKKHRGVAGLSMGGQGCASYAQRHPGLFQAAYAMSAAMEVGNRRDALDPDSKLGKLTLSMQDKSCNNFVANADEACKDALRTVEWYVDCGDDDFLLDCNVDFYQKMRNAGIPCQLRVRDGIHDWEYWHSALYSCLPFMHRAFTR